MGYFFVWTCTFILQLAKILFLFYIAKHSDFENSDFEKSDFKKIEVIQLLANPSMEILDTSLLKRQTYYGNISKFFMDRLRSEITQTDLSNISKYFIDRFRSEIYQTDLSNISKFFAEITLSWHAKLKEIEKNSLNYNGYIELILNEYKNILSNIEFPECCETYEFSPTEMLFLRIKQKKQLGQIKDAMFINNIKIETQYNTPPEMIEYMRIFANNKVTDINECIDKFINNPQETAKYVYKVNADSVDSYYINKIKTIKKKVIKALEFCNRADLSIYVEEALTELHIISCLQAILLDSQNEVFNYKFFRYKDFSRNKLYVQAALKKDNYVLEALKLYWHRKINDHWYANIGKYDVRCKLRELENIFDELLLKIFSYNNLSEIYNVHCYIFDKLPNKRVKQNEYLA